MRYRLACAAAIVCLLGGSSVLPAQTLTLRGESLGVPTTTAQPLPLGPILFSPSADLSWENRDNIFFRADNPVSDTVLLARANLLFELPVSNSKVTFSYTPQYRDYGSYQVHQHWSQFARLDGVFEFASGLKLTTNYRYVSGNQETQEFDPGGEIVFADSQFSLSDLRVVADYWLTPLTGVSVEGGSTDATFDNRALFYDYKRKRYGVGWLRQISPTLVMRVRYQHEKFDPTQTYSFRSSTSDEVTIGFQGEVSPVLTSELSIGARRTEFERTAQAPSFSNYSGFVARGSLTWALAHESTFKLELLRQDFPSSYGLNAYYTTTGGAATYSLQRGRLFGSLRYRYQRNNYQVADITSGQQRADKISSYAAQAGYHFTPTLAVRVAYDHEKRDSIQAYGYDSNMYLVGVVVGF